MRYEFLIFEDCQHILIEVLTILRAENKIHECTKVCTQSQHMLTEI